MTNSFDAQIEQFWRSGFDTVRIGLLLRLPESTVYNCLAAIREAANARKRAHDAVRVWI